MARVAIHKAKRVPQRTCVGCREVRAKRGLIRLVRTPDGVKIDPTGKKSGRGAYLHDNRSCWEKALKGNLGAALKVELTDAEKMILKDYASRLPEADLSEEDQVRS